MALTQPRKATGGGAYPAVIRWLAVWKRLGRGESHHTVTLELEGMPPPPPPLSASARRPGSLERWGGENANELRINGLMKCFYPRGYEAQYAVGPRRLEMSLEDVLRILRAPRVDPGGGLRWV